VSGRNIEKIAACFCCVARPIGEEGNIDKMGRILFFAFAHLFEKTDGFCEGLRMKRYEILLLRLRPILGGEEILAQSGEDWKVKVYFMDE
jgi:hypothetical protein